MSISAKARVRTIRSRWIRASIAVRCVRVDVRVYSPIRTLARSLKYFYYGIIALSPFRQSVVRPVAKVDTHVDTYYGNKSRTMTATLPSRPMGAGKPVSNNRTLVDRYYEKFDGQGHLIFDSQKHICARLNCTRLMRCLALVCLMSRNKKKMLYKRRKCFYHHAAL